MKRIKQNGFKHGWGWNAQLSSININFNVLADISFLISGLLFCILDIGNFE